MKKRLIIIMGIIIFCLSLGFVYRVYHNSGKMICTYVNKTDVYTIKNKYTIEYEDRVVKRLVTEEVITSSDKEMLSEYNESLSLLYSKYYDFKYYDNSIVLDKDKLVSKTIINYDKLDKDKFIKIDKANKKLYTDNQVKLSTLRKMYKENDISCKYQ